jgi:hypothetical protein
MKKNVGTIDRIVRVAAGIGMLGAGIAFQSWWGAVGIIPLATAFMRWCPAYSLVGLNTCSKETCGIDGDSCASAGSVSGPL